MSKFKHNILTTQNAQVWTFACATCYTVDALLIMLAGTVQVTHLSVDFFDSVMADAQTPPPPQRLLLAHGFYSN